MADNGKKPKVYEVGLDEVKQLPNNPNDGTQRGDYMLEESMQQGGVGRGILLADDDTILAGNHSTQKYAELFADGKIVVVETDGDTLVANKRRDIPNADDPRAKKLIIADNRASEVGLSWSPEELQCIADDPDIDLGSWFYEDELDEIFAELDTDEPPEDVGAQVDRAAELQEVWQTERGQVWVIESKTVPGKSHRVMCGDSTSAEDVAVLMGDALYDSLITDPPFFTPASHYQSRKQYQRKFSDLSSLAAFWELTMNTTDKYKKQESHVVVFCNADSYAVFYPVMFPRFDKTKNLVWDKTKVGLGRVFRHRHELMIWGRNQGHYFEPDGTLYSDVISFEATASREREHPVEKPVALMEYLIKPLTPQSGNVFDPFCGSGSIGVAAERLARLALMMEMDASYCAVILQRLTDLGLEPVLHDQPNDVNA